MLITPRENAAVFGDVQDPDFEEKNIIPVKLPGFGKNKNEFWERRFHRLIAETLVAAFEAVQKLGLSYVLKTSTGFAAAYCFRYARLEENKKLLESKTTYAGLTDAEKAAWNVTYAKEDAKHRRLNECIGPGTHTRHDHLSKHSWGSAFDINPTENPLGAGRDFDLPFEIVKELGRFGFFWGGYFPRKGADYMHFQWGRKEPPTGGAGARVAVQVPRSFETPSSHVVFPFATPGTHESPTKYFFLNEHHGRGGYFPLGLYQNLHSGIHLNPLLAANALPVADSDLPDTPGQNDDGGSYKGPAAEGTRADAPPTALLPVRAALPGYMVAARLVDYDLLPAYKDNKWLQENLEGQPLGFVLIRHELMKPKPPTSGQGGAGTAEGSSSAPPPTSTWPIYSLYMHLAAPKWDAKTEGDKKADKRFEAAPWLEKFLRMEYGGVVVLDPGSSDDFGKTFWASEAFKATETTPIAVRGKERPLDRSDRDHPGRTLGYGKPSPPPIAEAIERFKQGSVVTFDRPLLPVAAGEVIGFLDGVQGTAGSRRYLHWEIFAQPGQGLAKLRECAADLGITFDEPLKELCEDNFLEMPSLSDPGAPKEIEAFFKKPDPVLNPVITRARYAKKLVAAFQEGKDFAGDGKTSFRYTTTLKFANKYKFKPDDPEAGKVEITYLAGGKPVESPTTAVLEFGEHITVKLDVPAAADIVRLRSAHFRLDLAPPPPPAPARGSNPPADKRREFMGKSRRKLWKAVTGRRWRNLVLEHINEWTAQNLEKHIKTKLKAAYFTSTSEQDREKLGVELVKALAPLTWYAPPKAADQAHGEQLGLGDGSRHASLFGADESFLPKDGHLESMHPATTLWLVDLLLDEGKVAFRDTWAPDNLIAEAAADKPLFLAVVGASGGTAVGASVGLGLIQAGYEFSKDCTDSGVIFAAKPEGYDARILAVASYAEGAAVAKVRFPYWGKTEIKALAQKRGKLGGTELAPQAHTELTLDVPKPEPAGRAFTLVRQPGTKPNVQMWSGTLLVKSGRPLALEGYLAFTYWKAEMGKQPDFSQPGAPGDCLWPVTAERASDEEHERDGLRWKGDFILGLAKKSKGSARTVHVSADFVLQDFVDKKVAEATENKFRVALPLIQRLQALRDACKSKKRAETNTGFAVTTLAEDGVSVRVAPSKQSSVAAILERASALPPSDLFTLEADPDGKTLQLSYAPSDSTAALSFTTDFTPALQALANSASLASGEQLFARPIFIAPNGGHHVFSDLDEPPIVNEDHAVMATADDLGKASAGEPIRLEAEIDLPPAHAFAIGPFSITMGRGTLRTTVALLGPVRDWGTAKVKITCTVGDETIIGGTPEGRTVAEYWYLEKWQHDKKGRPTGTPKSRWGKTFTFKAELVSTKGIANPPAPVEATFDAAPKLASLDIALEEDLVVFRGTAHAMPTSTELGIRCERQSATGTWRHAHEVTDALTYQRRSATSPEAWGSPNGDLTFLASAPKSAFTLTNYRFIWHALSFSELRGERQDDLTLKLPELGNLQIAPLMSRVYSGVELGGSGSPPVDEPEPERIEPGLGDFHGSP